MSNVSNMSKMSNFSKADVYTGELTSLRDRLKGSGIDPAYVSDEVSNIELYLSVLRGFDRWDPKTQDIILEDARRDADRINEYIKRSGSRGII